MNPLQPLVAGWAELGLIVADEFRESNVPANLAPLSCAQPEQVSEYAFRGDSAGHERALLRWLRAAWPEEELRTAKLKRLWLRIFAVPGPIVRDRCQIRLRLAASGAWIRKLMRLFERFPLITRAPGPLGPLSRDGRGVCQRSAFSRSCVVGPRGTTLSARFSSPS